LTVIVSFFIVLANTFLSIDNSIRWGAVSKVSCSCLDSIPIVINECHRSPNIQNKTYIYLGEHYKSIWNKFSDRAEINPYVTNVNIELSETFRWNKKINSYDLLVTERFTFKNLFLIEYKQELRFEESLKDWVLECLKDHLTDKLISNYIMDYSLKKNDSSQQYVLSIYHKYDNIDNKCIIECTQPIPQ